MQGGKRQCPGKSLIKPPKRQIMGIDAPSFEEEINSLLLASDQSDSHGVLYHKANFYSKLKVIKVKIQRVRLLQKKLHAIVPNTMCLISTLYNYWCVCVEIDS